MESFARIGHFILALITASSLGFAQSVFPVRDEGEARDKTYDVLHYAIHVSINDHDQKVVGRVTTTLVPYPFNLSTIEFDAEQMEIHRVVLHGRDLRYEVRPKTVAIALDRPYSFHDTLALIVDYSCHPSRGLYFVQPDSGYPDKPRQIWSQGEDMDNHFWFPCYDFPNDKATSELIVTLPSYYTAVSNGALVSVSENAEEKTKTFHWKENKPHASYLIMLAAGEYSILRDRAGTLPVEYYVYPHHVDDARVCFSETPRMIRFFNEKIGFIYPWEKYAQVLIKDFVVGGMENTSATSLADGAAVYDARARLDDSPVSLLAHELAHQWWGDVVTCKDWRHLWLNESFASYFDPLYFEYSVGRDEFDYQMYNAQNRGIEVDKRLGRKPIVSVGSYGENVYPRGASVLHMLRFVLGDSLFWKSMNHYITKHQFQSVETNDLKVAVEEATGLNLYWFFNQWIYGAGYPVFDVSYTWNDSSRTIDLRVHQTQKIDSLTGVFRTPVDIDITTPTGTITHRVTVESGDTVFTLPAPAKPTLVIFDKGNWLLKELNFTKSPAEWLTQAEYAANPVDRLRALRVLSNMQDSVPCAALLARLSTSDRFWAVRREATTRLGWLDTADEGVRSTVRTTLLTASWDRRSSVRAEALGQLEKFRDPEVLVRLHDALQDSSYLVVSSAVRALARAESANATPMLLAFLSVPSQEKLVAAAALRSLEEVDSTKAVAAALEKVKYGQPDNLRYTALSILTHRAHRNKDLLPVLIPLVRDKSRGIRQYALWALEEAGDATVLPVLDSIAAETANPMAARAADAAKKVRRRLETP
jgi:aminopeptidase N